MLFVLAIGPLYLLFYKAQQSGLLKKFSAGNNILGASLYADDAPLFIHPAQRELEIIAFILQLFAAASGSTLTCLKQCTSPYIVRILIWTSLLKLEGWCPPGLAPTWGFP
jgi:hypothetical protein